MRRETLVLTKKEILAELKNLGINTDSELHSCLNEYKYYALQNNFPNLSAGTSRLYRKLLLKRRVEKTR
jgi:hypothetical protein